MATNLDIIKGALQLLGVLDETEEASAEQAQLGLTVMNDFLEDWADLGIDVGQYPQTDLTADYPGPRGTVLTVKAALAVNLAPYFPPAQPSAVVIVAASAGYQRLLREAQLRELNPITLPHIPGGSGTWDIETG